MLFAAVAEVIRRFYWKMHQLLYYRKNIAKKVNWFLGLKHLKVCLKSFKSNFIAILIFAILCCFFLYSVISQMNILISAIFEAKLVAWCSNIANRIKICRDEWRGSNKYKTSYIEFSSMKKIGRDILLYDEGSLAVLLLLFLDVSLYLVYSLAYLYPAATVGVLSRFYYPK